MKPQLFPVLFMDKTPINVQNIIPRIFVFSVNSLLFSFPPAAGIRPGSRNYLGMEDIFIQLNIAVHHRSNMSFWLLHAASEHSYQKCLAILGMLRRAFKGRHYWEQTCFRGSCHPGVSKGTHSSKNRRIPLCTHMALKNISFHNGVNSCFLRVRKTLRTKHRAQ